MTDAMSSAGAPLKIFVVAGEESGDRLGGALIGALRQRAGGPIAFEGVGGRAMAAQGVPSLFPTDHLAIVGVVDERRGEGQDARTGPGDDRDVQATHDGSRVNAGP